MYRALDHFLAPDDVRDWSAELRPVYDEIEAAGAAAVAARAESRVEGTTPSHTLEAYAGTYESEMYGQVTVEVRGGALYVDRSPGLQGPASHWHHDTFLVEWEARWRGDALATFDVGASGAVSAVTVNGIRWARIG
jgi:hypothetical protein